MNPRTLIGELDELEGMADNVIKLLRSSELREEIVIEGSKARIEVDEKLDSIFSDVKKSTNTLKNIFSRTLNTPRFAVTDTFLKFYRLISENARKILAVAQKVMSGMPEDGLLGRTKRYAWKTIDKFTDTTNRTLETVNSFIPDRNYRIKLAHLPESRHDLVDEFLRLR